MNKFNALKFALAGGIWLGLCVFLCTIGAIVNIPGLPAFTDLINQFYSSWGYSVSWGGAIVGAFWGFVEGFVHLGFFALVYNWLNKK